MKTPSDHIVYFFPFTGRTRKNSNYKWRNTAPSRQMAFLTLLFFSTQAGSPEHEFAAAKLSDIRENSRLVWGATMAAIFGVNWTSARNPKVRSLMDLRCPAMASEAFSQDLVIAFIKAMIGQISVNAMLDLIRAYPDQWSAVRQRVSAIPGSSRFVSDLHHLLSGNKDLVSWAQPVPGAPDPDKIIGVSGRTLRGLRKDDGIVISTGPRKLALPDLLRRATRLASRVTDCKRLYTAKANDDKTVCITRMR